MPEVGHSPVCGSSSTPGPRAPQSTTRRTICRLCPTGSGPVRTLCPSQAPDQHSHSLLNPDGQTQLIPFHACHACDPRHCSSVLGPAPSARLFLLRAQHLSGPGHESVGARHCATFLFVWLQRQPPGRTGSSESSPLYSLHSRSHSCPPHGLPRMPLGFHGLLLYDHWCYLRIPLLPSRCFGCWSRCVSTAARPGYLCSPRHLMSANLHSNRPYCQFSSDLLLH
ncbi:hypothetical protein NDU88_003479 [Pleurodeles waltl]|uniref:Uncharacterized protein n=1 Tax=Pleurodeles waltl TaxID=8319 RepID=A0AAV7VGQ9_PLEWA|nr:hypothetical protein NDU88_003479 [Pleurodeles waltl]